MSLHEVLITILFLCPYCHGNASQLRDEGQYRRSSDQLTSEWYQYKRTDDVPALQTVVESLSQQLTEVKAQLTALESRCSSIESNSQRQFTELETKLDTARTNVAFQAYHSTDPFNVGAHGTLVYNAVFTNIGSSYDTQSGIFTAPHSGTYIFFVNCMAKSTPGEELRLVANGKSVASCYSSKFEDAEPFEQGATMSTVHLLKGQWAMVTTIHGEARDIRGSLWNTFAGFLVHADD